MNARWLHVCALAALPLAGCTNPGAAEREASAHDFGTKLARVNRATVFSAFLPTVAFAGNESLFSGRASGLPSLGSLETSGANFALKTGKGQLPNLG